MVNFNANERERAQHLASQSVHTGSKEPAQIKGSTLSNASFRKQKSLARNELNSASKGLEEIVLDQDRTAATSKQSARLSIDLLTWIPDDSARFHGSSSYTAPIAPTRDPVDTDDVVHIQALVRNDRLDKIPCLSTSQDRYQALPDDLEKVKRMVIDLIYN